MDCRMKALLQHRGLLTNVNHAHRLVAPTGATNVPAISSDKIDYTLLPTSARDKIDYTLLSTSARRLLQGKFRTYEKGELVYYKGSQKAKILSVGDKFPIEGLVGIGSPVHYYIKVEGKEGSINTLEEFLSPREDTTYCFSGEKDITRCTRPTNAK